MNKKVVIVMPAYNAEKTLIKTFNDIPKSLRIPKNIILVDDVSADKTVEVAKKLGINVVVHGINTGYGGNQKTCYDQALKSHADIVVMIHPDYQYDSSMTEELIRPLMDGWVDIMLGNRIRTRREALENGMPFYKYISNRILTAIENIILGTNLGEFHTGFRAYKANTLKELPYTKFSDDFVFDQEFLFSAVYNGFRIGEISIPVRYFDDASSISLKNSVIYGVKTLQVCLKYLLTKGKIVNYKIF
ncbi:MAG TPA: glycosyltransferase family 2 protein [Patescibacteria group bacterium]|nr:glycosyltransferase family 2 protein [Patescibacteria group bacterium]